MIFVADQLPRLVARRRHAARDRRSASSRVLGAGARLRRDQRRHRHLRPAAADRHHDRHRRDLSSASRCCCGRFPAASVNEDLADALTGQRLRRRPGEPRRAARRGPGHLGALQPLGDRPRRLRRRLVGGRRLHVGRADPPRASSPPIRCPACSPRIGGLFLTFFTYTGEAAYASGNAYTLFSIAAVVLGGVVAVRRHAAAPSARSSARSPSAPSATCSSSSTSTRCGSRCSRASCCCSPSASAPSACSACATAWSGSDERRRPTAAAAAACRLLRRVDPAVRHRLRLHPAAAARRQPLFARTSSRPTICCSSSRSPPSSASSPPA